MTFANVHDTLLAAHAIASHLPLRLDHVVSTYCYSAPWKILHGKRAGDEGEKGFAPEAMSGEELCEYNSSDTKLTKLSWDRLQSDLEPERAVYEHDRALAAVCREMILEGIGFDTTRKAELLEAMKVAREDLRLRLQTISGDADFNPGKLDSIRRYLFEVKKARYVNVTSKGLPSTGAATLEALANSPDESISQFASALIDWRLIGKIKSTYVEPIVPNPTTQRVHYNWKPFGTVSGRLSCKLQSAPRWNPKEVSSRVRELYIPRPGNVFIYYDVSQAEMRLAAYLSADAEFIAACAGDVHANNAAAVFPEIAAKGWLSDKAAKSDPARGKQFRDIAKNLGFAISYCAEADKLFITLQSKGFNVSRAACESILMKLHSKYRVYYKWVNANLERVRRVGHLRSPFVGRIRWLGWFPKITDVANYPIQSGLADVVNLRMIELSRILPSACRLVAQIHDACIYDCPETIAEASRKIIQDVWNQPLTTPGGPLILPVDLKVGHRWSDF